MYSGTPLETQKQSYTGFRLICLPLASVSNLPLNISNLLRRGVRLTAARHPVNLSCNTLQHTATHCNTLQHTATHVRLTAARHPVNLSSLMRCFVVLTQGWGRLETKSPVALGSSPELSAFTTLLVLDFYADTQLTLPLHQQRTSGGFKVLNPFFFCFCCCAATQPSNYIRNAHRWWAVMMRRRRVTGSAQLKGTPAMDLNYFPFLFYTFCLDISRVNISWTKRRWT